MKNPTDMLGNELVEGQQVMFHIPQPALLHAQVMKVQPGGISGPGGQKSPALVVLQVVFPFQMPPGSSIPSVVRIITPQDQSIIDKLTKGLGADPA